MLAIIGIVVVSFGVAAALGYLPNFRFWSSPTATSTKGDFGSPRGSTIIIGLVPLLVLYFYAYVGVKIVPHDAVLPGLISGLIGGLVGGVIGMFKGISAYVAKRDAFEAKKKDDAAENDSGTDGNGTDGK